MKSVLTLLFLSSLIASPVSAAGIEGTVILEDHFEREEADPAREDVGNDWGTNSLTRAQGVKQVDLREGALYITKADVADHGVSVTHEVAFQDARIELRFKLDSKDDLGINIADMHEKSVHAGHICMARIQPQQVEIVDLKTGRMDLQTREARLAGNLTPEREQEIKKKSKFFKIDLETSAWHTLLVTIHGEKMSVMIDGKVVGEFQSAGIGHPTKSRLRLAVNRSAWIDDVKVTHIQ